MTESFRPMLLETARRIFRRHAGIKVVAGASQAIWPEELWTHLEENGFTQVSAEGLSFADGLALMRVAGYFSAPVPLGEAMVASAVLAAAKMNLPEGPIGLGTAQCLAAGHSQSAGDSQSAGHSQPHEYEIRQTPEGVLVTGVFSRVPWARNCQSLVLVFPVQGGWAAGVVQREGLHLEHGENLAGEPRDEVRLVDVILQDFAMLPKGWTGCHVLSQTALMQVMAASGALERLLEMTIAYANQRKQFGRPIARFQAVQHEIAELAAEAYAMQAAANGIVSAFDGFEPDLGAWTSDQLQLGNQLAALGKMRLAQAAHIAGQNAHQVHGAMGFTMEYPLHFITRRLWSWRQEYGNETTWAGSVAADLQTQEVWNYLTSY